MIVLLEYNSPVSAKFMPGNYSEKIQLRNKLCGARRLRFITLHYAGQSFMSLSLGQKVVFKQLVSLVQY